jgi:hypothetical protein
VGIKLLPFSPTILGTFGQDNAWKIGVIGVFASICGRPAWNDCRNVRLNLPKRSVPDADPIRDPKGV